LADYSLTSISNITGNLLLFFPLGCLNVYAIDSFFDDEKKDENVTIIYRWFVN
jgi:hypothetical protein